MAESRPLVKGTRGLRAIAGAEIPEILEIAADRLPVPRRKRVVVDHVLGIVDGGIERVPVVVPAGKLLAELAQMAQGVVVAIVRFGRLSTAALQALEILHGALNDALPGTLPIVPAPVLRLRERNDQDQYECS